MAPVTPPNRGWCLGQPQGRAASVDEQRQVRIGHRSAAGHSHSFDVDPWSVVVRYGRWYLLCFAHHAAADVAAKMARSVSVAP